MSSKHKERDRERDRERSKSHGKESSSRSDKIKDRRDRSRDRSERKERSERSDRSERSERRRSSRDRDAEGRDSRRSRSRERHRRRRSRSKEQTRGRGGSRDRDDRRRGFESGGQAQQRAASPAPLIDDELLQLQMVQSLIKDDPSASDFNKVILEAIAAAAATSDPNPFGVSSAAALATTRARSINEMFGHSTANAKPAPAVAAAPPPVKHHNPFATLLPNPYQIQMHQHQQQREAALQNESATNGNSSGSGTASDRARKKKSRWGGSENDKTFIPGMPTILPASLDSHQQEAYLVQLQIEEISRKLRTGDLNIGSQEERSPSPEPIYSSDGKRLNTREFRTRKRLEDQRHQLVVRMQCMNPDFKPPVDYKPPIVRVSDKVLIPQEEHPDINFVGLLIGPRGNTLKAMEKDTGAKIIIRGKGSVKEGKVGRKDGQPLPGEDEPLHAFITAANPECVKKAVDKIKDVIRQGIEVPEGHNDLRRMQLRELAQLNGTLRETDGPRCTNCGSTDHKSWLCPDKPNITNSIVCTSCGGAGHIAKDCRSKRPGASYVEGGDHPDDEADDTDDAGNANAQAKIDEEYLSLMAELGEGPAPKAKEVDALAQAQLSRASYSLFDRPGARGALQGSSNHHGQHHGNHVHHQQNNHMHHQQLHHHQQQHNSGHHLQPAWAPAPPPGPPPPLMGWMQPPPPGQEAALQPPPPPLPPGTTAAAMPPPPGTASVGGIPQPPWAQQPPPPPQFPWGGAPPPFIPPPPPGPPPPPPPASGLPGGLLQPPPPPPPQ